MRDKLNQIFNTQKSVCKIDSIQGELNKTNFVERKWEKKMLRKIDWKVATTSACTVLHVTWWITCNMCITLSVLCMFMCVCVRAREAYLLGSFNLSISWRENTANVRELTRTAEPLFNVKCIYSTENPKRANGDDEIKPIGVVRR